MRERLLVSACLLGARCRYDGERVKKIDTEALISRFDLVPFCPEIYGGLPTPRTPSERVGERVLMKDGTDVTYQYKRGAEEACRLCGELGIKYALLKARSPSCGVGRIYDGSFSMALTEGDGVCAEMLRAQGIAVFSEEELERLYALVSE